MENETTTFLAGNSDEFGTPAWLFEKLNREFSFTIDVAATSQNAKCPSYYTKEDDGLKQSWSLERVFCNPPYSRGNMVQWIEKAHRETHLDCILVVLLLPDNRCEQEWFHRLVRPYAEHRHIQGRVKYDGGATGASFPSMIVVFRNPKYLIW